MLPVNRPGAVAPSCIRREDVSIPPLAFAESLAVPWQVGKSTAEKGDCAMIRRFMLRRVAHCCEGA